MRPLLVTLAALALILPVQMKVDAVRREHKMTPSGDELQERSPIEVIATVGLGGFRGLAVDYLWFRAMQMQEEHRYYEIALLCELILRMEPFPQIWAFHAWNMAYNISAEMPEREQRWLWISRAIDILENEGIPQNEQSYVLHWELGWIFYHRCTPKGGDDHARAFAAEVARAHPEIEGSDLSVVFQLAEKHFRAAASKDDISPMKRWRALALAVHCLEGRGDWQGAEREWKKLLAESPETDTATRHGFINFYRAIVFRYHVDGKQEDSRRWYAKYRKAFPAYARSYEETLEEAERELGDVIKPREDR